MARPKAMATSQTQAYHQSGVSLYFFIMVMWTSGSWFLAVLKRYQIFRRWLSRVCTRAAMREANDRP